MSETAIMCEKLGLPMAPKVVLWMQEAVTYFRSHLSEDPLKWVSYFKGIDFHSPVEQKMLATGLHISRHLYLDPKPEKRAATATKAKPFIYFTVPGTSQFSTGTSFDSSVFEEFMVTGPIWALISTASSMSFDRKNSSSRKDTTSRVGGGMQYIISAADFKNLRRA